MSNPKSQSSSVTEMTEFVLPQHANALGNVFGGQVMAWTDLCAAICAQRHSGEVTVTAVVDAMRFQKPVKVGDVLRLRATVTATFRTSMEIEVVVQGENPRTGQRWPCLDARLVFVAINGTGKPVPVPPLVLDSDAVRMSQAEGERRRALRLSQA